MPARPSHLAGCETMSWHWWLGSDLEHGQTTVTTVAQCQSIQSLMVGGGQAEAMYMSSPWSVPGGLGSRCRTRLFSGSARDGKCSRPILERDVLLLSIRASMR